jgi:hypothetical protein
MAIGKRSRGTSGVRIHVSYTDRQGTPRCVHTYKKLSREPGLRCKAWPRLISCTATHIKLVHNLEQLCASAEASLPVDASAPATPVRRSQRLSSVAAELSGSHAAAAPLPASQPTPFVTEPPTEAGLAPATPELRAKSKSAALPLSTTARLGAGRVDERGR